MILVILNALLYEAEQTRTIKNWKFNKLEYWILISRLGENEMIDKNTFIKVLIERAKKLPVGHYLDIRSYKRNRTVFVVKKDHDSFLVIEDGFFKEEFRVNLAKLKKLFKVILRKEFPRSHKVRLYTMGKYNEKEAKAIKRKKI